MFLLSADIFFDGMIINLKWKIVFVNPNTSVLQGAVPINVLL
jgi:hypothetical protein